VSKSEAQRKRQQEASRRCYLKNRVRRLERSRRYRAENPEKCKKWYLAHYYRFHDEHLLKMRAYQRAFREKLKDEMFQAYGAACVCCRENRREFLTLDHIDGQGRDHGLAHRKWGIGGTPVYLDLRRKGWPKDHYRILCMNCNWAKRGGLSCPHEVERTQRAHQNSKAS